MTDFRELSIGQTTEFHRVLASAGVTKEDIESFLKQPQKGAYVALIARIKTPVVQEIFTTHPSHGDLMGSLKSKGGFKLQEHVSRP